MQKLVQLSATQTLLTNIPVEGLIDNLKPAIYSLGLSQDGEILFNRMGDRFNYPETVMKKIYNLSDTVINAYEAREGSTGVLLTGLKGTGKTVLSEVIGNWFVDNNLPVIVVKEYSVPVNIIRKALSILPKGCLVIFEELTKIYSTESVSDDPSQTELLTLMSDSNIKKVMFIATDNNIDDVNTYFLDRPQRFLFNIKFGPLVVNEIKTYCNDKKVPLDITNFICSMAFYANLSFDVLTVLADIGLKVSSLDEFKDLIVHYNVPKVRYIKLGSVDKSNIKGCVEVFDTDLTLQRLNDDVERVSLFDPRVTKIKDGKDTFLVIQLSKSEIVYLSFTITDLPVPNHYIIKPL